MTAQNISIFRERFFGYQTSVFVCISNQFGKYLRINLEDNRSQQHPLSHFPTSCVFNSRSLVTASNSGDSSASRAHIITVANIPQLNCSANCLQDNSTGRITQKTQPLFCCRGVFTAPLYSNGRGSDHIENTVLLLRACCRRYLATAAIYRVTA
jgi:hypothetical protein